MGACTRAARHCVRFLSVLLAIPQADAWPSPPVPFNIRKISLESFLNLNKITKPYSKGTCHLPSWVWMLSRSCCMQEFVASLRCYEWCWTRRSSVSSGTPNLLKEGRSLMKQLKIILSMKLPLETSAAMPSGVDDCSLTTTTICLCIMYNSNHRRIGTLIFHWS